jgi:hypothetical protein
MKRNIFFATMFILILSPPSFLLPFSYADGESSEVKDFLIMTNYDMTGLSISSSSEGVYGNFTKNKDSKKEATFSVVEKVKIGLIQNLNKENIFFNLDTREKSIFVENNASTTFVFGDGRTASVDDLKNDKKVYVFGYIKSDNSIMLATKIVVANKSIMTRK